jgi:hypothetical protein
MSCDILNNEQDDQAVFFCNTSDWAFGPVMMPLPDYENSAYETARAFEEWLPLDPRRYSDNDLANKWSEFIMRSERMAKYTKEDHDADVADMKHSDGEVN